MYNLGFVPFCSVKKKKKKKKKKEKKKRKEKKQEKNRGKKEEKKGENFATLQYSRNNLDLCLTLNYYNLAIKRTVFRLNARQNGTQV